MLLLDTHFRVWWVHGSARLSTLTLEILQEHESAGMAVNVFSCWEVAKLVERGRLDLRMPVREWTEVALSYPGIELLGLTPEIVVESTQLPGAFHKDPADQLIVATARVEGLALATCDQKLVEYPHVETLDLR